MSFFYKNIYPRDVVPGSVELKEKVYSEVVKDGVSRSVVKCIDPSKDIDLPLFDDYSLEKRLKAGVDINPVSLNVSDEPNEIDDEIKNTILSDSSVTSHEDVSHEDVSHEDVSHEDESHVDEINV